MEGRERRSGAQVSPERYMVWKEPSGKRRIRWKQGARVPVVYYLCNDRLLEHPHFIEVPFSSTDGLYLRDVIDCLVVLRGNRMPAMYSWSCKRSYRNGFVWQDLAKDDLILPAKGDYILKGSLLPDQISSDGIPKNNYNQVLQRNQHRQQKEHILYSRKSESSSGEMRPLCLPFQRSSITVMSSSSFRDCRDFVPTRAPLSSTQTEDPGGRKAPEPGTQTTTLSINNELPPSDFNETRQKFVRSFDRVVEEASQAPVRRNAGMGTLLSLIRAEVNQLDGFGGGTGKCSHHQSKEKIKRTNALFQLISCRSFFEKINIW